MVVRCPERGQNIVAQGRAKSPGRLSVALGSRPSATRALKGRHTQYSYRVAPSGNAVKHFFLGIGAIVSSCVRQNADGERPKIRILANAATKMLHSVACRGERKTQCKSCDENRLHHKLNA